MTTRRSTVVRDNHTSTNSSDVRIALVPRDERFRELGLEVGDLVARKNESYGDSVAKSGDFLKLLYPTGLIPDQFGDALLLIRIFDKCMRIATRKDAFGESPYRDIAGYAIRGAEKDATQIG